MRERALITGASSGIGRELARVFAEHDFDVVLVARRKRALEELAGELKSDYGCRAVVLPCDLTADHAPQRLFDAVRRRRLRIDVLINNAGIALFDDFVAQPVDDQLAMIRLNVVAPTALARLFAEPMVRRGHGRILNVASVAGFQPTPWLAVYGATKAFLVSLTEALSVELAGTGVTVTALCPGFTDTALVESAEDQLGKPDLVPPVFMLDPVEVARQGFEACMAGRTLCICGRAYELAVYAERVQPRWVVRALTGLIARRFRTED